MRGGFGWVGGAGWRVWGCWSYRPESHHSGPSGRRDRCPPARRGHARAAAPLPASRRMRSARRVRAGTAAPRPPRRVRGRPPRAHRPRALEGRHARAAARGAVLSHRSAAELWELLPPSGGAPHVTLPYPASPAKRANLNIHRSRTLAGSAHDEPLQHPGHHARPHPRRPRPYRDRGRASAGRPARPRSAASRSTPGSSRTGPRATSSATSSRSAAASGFRSLSVNVRIGGYRVDFLWRDERLVIEVDGYIYHRGRQAMRDDNDRDLELELAGFRVVRIEDSRITDDPAGVAAAVRGLLASRPIRSMRAQEGGQREGRGGVPDRRELARLPRLLRPARNRSPPRTGGRPTRSTGSRR